LETKETERLTMTVEEAAQAIGISRGTAYDLIHQKKLPAIRISERRLVVPIKAIEKMLEGLAGTIPR
jgi:excisionase family DNA binding protein